MAHSSMNGSYILVADVTASVELYERIGDEAAFARIASVLDRLRARTEEFGGCFVQSRGDDVLCLFSQGGMAADAAATMHDDAHNAGVNLRVAIHCGEPIVARESIFGDAVNVAYRLAAIANSNETLASGEAISHFSDRHLAQLRALRSFRFKGREALVDVFSIDSAIGSSLTTLPDNFLAAEKAAILLRLSYNGYSWAIGEAESLSMGRADGIDVKIERPWVSRQHAVFFVRDDAALFTDRSTYGSFVAPNGGVEMRLRRQTVPLSGSGTISLGVSARTPEAVLIDYTVMRQSKAVDTML